MTQTWRFRTVARRAFPFLLAAIPVAPSLLTLPVPARAADVLNASTGDEVSAVFEKAKPAVVKVRSGDDHFALAGSGFFIDSKGTVLTSSTVVGNNGAVTVEVNGAQMEAKVLGNDPRSGLAMLRVSYNAAPFLPLGHSLDLKTGNEVVGIGYPLNLPVAASQGLVNGFEVRYLNQFFATTHIHASASLSPGEVGGPLLNARGEVIGLVVPSPDDGRTTYALPVEAMQKIIADFNQYGCAKHGWVGVNVVESKDVNLDGRSVRVVQIEPTAPASKSGIKPGDTVMRIDSYEIYRPSDVLDASFFSHVGGTMNVLVRRDAKMLSYNFPVIERPQNHFAPAQPTQPVVHGAGSSAQPIVINHGASGSQ